MVPKECFKINNYFFIVYKLRVHRLQFDRHGGQFLEPVHPPARHHARGAQRRDRGSYLAARAAGVARAAGPHAQYFRRAGLEPRHQARAAEGNCRRCTLLFIKLTALCMQE